MWPCVLLRLSVVIPCQRAKTYLMTVEDGNAHVETLWEETVPELRELLLQTPHL